MFRNTCKILLQQQQEETPQVGWKRGATKRRKSDVVANVVKADS